MIVPDVIFGIIVVSEAVFSMLIMLQETDLIEINVGRIFSE